MAEQPNGEMSLNWPTATYANGRNGSIQQHGIEVQAMADSNIHYGGHATVRGIMLRPITSRGHLSMACELSVPVDQIDSLIELLQKAKQALV